MAKKPKQPRAKKHPKKPKQSASAAAWINYDKKCSEITKENARKLSEWKKKISCIDSAAKTNAALIKKHSR